MIRLYPGFAARRRMAGLSLIEMMVALVMALIVVAGIVSVFVSTSASSKVQAQMAALQEEGRFAIYSLRSDLGNANSVYCSNTGGNAGETASGLYLDALRSPTVYSNDATAITRAFSDNTTPLPVPTEAFSLPSSMYMRGYDCTTTECKPDDPHTTVSTIPPMGKAVGDRVPGAHVLTVRYLRSGSGWAVSLPGSATGSTVDAAADGTVTGITLNPLPGEDATSDFKEGDLAMLADCSNAQVFSVAVAGDTLTLTGATLPNSRILDLSRSAAPRVFDFSKDFQTVTYYLKVVCVNGSDPCTASTTGALIRRVNGREDVAGAGELVRGVERLNFRYGIIGADGNTRFLTADEIDAGVDSNGNSIACYVSPGQTGDVALPGGMPGTGCLWRAVQTIQASILMDGQTPLYTMTPAELKYIYTPDGNGMLAPSAHAVQPRADQGFPEPLIRREFTALIALRNFNP